MNVKNVNVKIRNEMFNNVVLAQIRWRSAGSVILAKKKKLSGKIHYFQHQPPNLTYIH